MVHTNFSGIGRQALVLAELAETSFYVYGTVCVKCNYTPSMNGKFLSHSVSGVDHFVIISAWRNEFITQTGQGFLDMTCMQYRAAHECIDHA